MINKNELIISVGSSGYSSALLIGLLLIIFILTNGKSI